MKIIVFPSVRNSQKKANSVETPKPNVKMLNSKCTNVNSLDNVKDRNAPAPAGKDFKKEFESVILVKKSTLSTKA